MTVNFWCGFVAFMAVCFGFVLFFLYDYTGSEPETVIDWILIVVDILCAVIGTILAIVI